MAKYNELHDMVAELVAEKKGYSKDADKANAVQYGSIRFKNAAEARAWWEKLPPAKKKEHIEKNGNESVLKMLGRPTDVGYGGAV
jgi:hypothetical protein